MPNLTCTTTLLFSNTNIATLLHPLLAHVLLEICGAKIPRPVLAQVKTKPKPLGGPSAVVDPRKPTGGLDWTTGPPRVALDPRGRERLPTSALVWPLHTVCVPHHGRLRLRAAPRAHKLVRHLELEPVHDALRRGSSTRESSSSTRSSRTGGIRTTARESSRPGGTGPRAKVRAEHSPRRLLRALCYHALPHVLVLTLLPTVCDSRSQVPANHRNRTHACTRGRRWTTSSIG